MTPEGALRTRLLSAAAVTTVVGTRIYQDIAAQQPTSPYVLVRLVDEPSDYHLRGPDRLTRARVQVEACILQGQSTRPELDVLAAAVHAALDGAIFAADDREVVCVRRAGRRLLFDAEELRLVRIVQDYLVDSYLT